MRDFRATNEKGTCLWCGRKLRGNNKDAWDGLFDLRSCAEAFGVHMATALHRIYRKVSK